VTLHDKLAKVIDYDTYLLEADTKYGLVKAWISPDAGHNCLQWEISKRQNQFYRDGKLTNDNFTGWTARFTADRVDRIDGQYVVTQATFNKEVTNGDIVLSSETSHYRLTHIDFRPDYAALGAFAIQLPEGTVVIDEDAGGIRYEWVGGQLQPVVDDIAVDVIDSAVDGLREKRKTAPEEQVAESERDSTGKRAARTAGEQVSDHPRRLLGSAVVVLVVVVTTCLVYRHRRKVRRK
jgi:hypothetical protein